MKLAISNIAWTPEENERVIEVIQNHGIAGIEVAPTLLFAKPGEVGVEEAVRVREFWKGKGLSLVAMQALLFGHPELVIFKDEESRDLTATYLAKMIALAGHLGVKALVFGSPANRKIDGLAAHKVREISRTFFRKLATVATQHNTTFCIEPNAAAYGCDFITNTSEAVELVRDVDHPGFKVHLDAGVMTLNGESYEGVLEKAIPFLGHFHISEPHLQSITENVTDHARLGRALRQLGYDGWISIEMKSGLGNDNVGVIDACLEFTRRTYLN